MKKYIVVFILILSSILIISSLFQEKENDSLNLSVDESVFKHEWVNNQLKKELNQNPTLDSISYIGHAFGSIENHIYTNSLDAFLHNYEKGMRFFEVDLMFTEDGELVLRHNWKEYDYDILNQKDKVPNSYYGHAMSLKMFKNTPINDKYTPITFEELLQIMTVYKDIYIITDTKNLEEQLIIDKFNYIYKETEKINSELLNRFIIQLYKIEMYDIVESIYHFNEYWYTMYQDADRDHDELVNFIKTKDRVTTVVMSYTYPLNTPKLPKRLEAEDIKIVYYTLNDKDILSKLLEKRKFNGIITDDLFFESGE